MAPAMQSNDEIGPATISSDHAQAHSGGIADFRTTHWSLVLCAGHDSSPQSAMALETLCRAYWYPLYVYVRRQGHGPHDAQDLTQEFFARLLRLNSLATVAPHKGRFRTFLLVSLKHFLADAWDAATAAKRGGNKPLVSLDEEGAEERYRLEPASEPTPDVAFERRWVMALLEQALARLLAEYASTGKVRTFELLKTFLETPADDGDYERAGAALGMNPGAVAVAVHRLRQRYRDLVRAEIAQTVSSPEEMEEELRHLFGG
jgi:DNA-directed RNA polymerase specialized sigma24 family protein